MEVPPLNRRLTHNGCRFEIQSRIFIYTYAANHQTTPTCFGRFCGHHQCVLQECRYVLTVTANGCTSVICANVTYHVFFLYLRSGNACYHSVQNLLSSRLLSKNLKIKIYRNIILPVVLYGCETWSLKRREERKLRVFENMVLRRILDLGGTR